MKIIFPEISQNVVAREAAESFKDIEFVPAESLEQAAEMLGDGLADTVVTGLDYATRDVILAFKGKIPLKSAFFSSCFICEKDGEVLAIADGGVNKNPNKEQLYTIIEDTAETFTKYTGKKPKIALLSYSTYGSGGKNSDLEKYYWCMEQIRKYHPEWEIDGEMQLDAAVNPDVAKKKMPESPLKGLANVLITPDLNSGNILYKSLEQFGGFTIAGPMLQGFEVPLADLSRGSTVNDIVLTIKVLRGLL